MSCGGSCGGACGSPECRGDTVARPLFVPRERAPITVRKPVDEFHLASRFERRPAMPCGGCGGACGRPGVPGGHGGAAALCRLTCAAGGVLGRSGDHACLGRPLGR
jgi:hypothetical protein